MARPCLSVRRSIQQSALSRRFLPSDAWETEKTRAERNERFLSKRIRDPNVVGREAREARAFPLAPLEPALPLPVHRHCSPGMPVGRSGRKHLNYTLRFARLARNQNHLLRCWTMRRASCFLFTALLLCAT